jgi:hypothetical protein
MGADSGLDERGFAGYAMLLVGSAGEPIPPYYYTWAQAVADGAGTSEPSGDAAVSTQTTLEASSTSPAVGETVTYTATVTPARLAGSAPSGTVAFFDGATEIGNCSEQPLTQSSSSSTATCHGAYAEPGTNEVSAVYSGQGAYSGSSSSVQTVTVHANPGPGGPPSGGGGVSLPSLPGGSFSGSTVSLPPLALPTYPSTLTPTRGVTGSDAVRGAAARAQLLAKALKQCKKQPTKRKRAECEAAAKKKYGSKARSKKKSKNGKK